jgi:hypothetical protein
LATLLEFTGLYTDARWAKGRYINFANVWLDAVVKAGTGIAKFQIDNKEV